LALYPRHDLGGGGENPSYATDTTTMTMIKKMTITIISAIITTMKKVLGGDANIARWLCSKAEPKISPRPGARDGQNLTSWRWSLLLPTNPVWWGSTHAISSYRGNRPTNTHSIPQTRPITIYCAAASAQCN